MKSSLFGRKCVKICCASLLHTVNDASLSSCARDKVIHVLCGAISNNRLSAWLFIREHTIIAKTHFNAGCPTSRCGNRRIETCTHN